MSIAWKPPECHVLKAIDGVSVGLCAEYDVRGGLNASQVSGWFSWRRNSLRTTGRVGSAMSTKRAQPHGQPWPAAVIVPYTSSETYAQSLFQSLTAECAPGPAHCTRLACGVTSRQ